MAEAADIKIDDYYNKIHRHTWIRRTAGLLTGATLGGAYGAMIGAVAAYLPAGLAALGVAGVTAAALPTLAVVATTAALFAGITAIIGIALTADVSANSASIAAGLEEKEKRENGSGISPEKVKDSPLSQLYVPRVAMVTIPLFAAFGAVIGLSPLTASAAVGALGITGGSAAAVAASSLIFAMGGAFMGFKNSQISNQLSNFYYKAVTDQLFNPAQQKETAAPEIKRNLPDTVAEDTLSEEKSFAGDKKPFSAKNILEKGKGSCPHQGTGLGL